MVFNTPLYASSSGNEPVVEGRVDQEKDGLYPLNPCRAPTLRVYLPSILSLDPRQGKDEVKAVTSLIMTCGARPGIKHVSRIHD